MVETNPNAKTRKRLGRGLASLMNQPVSVKPPLMPASREQPAAARLPSETLSADVGNGLRMIAVDRIQPNRYQPRKQIDPIRLEALAASIRQSGVMQPILVRNGQGSAGYEIVAGERRWRAAQLAGLKELPAIHCDLDDAGAAEWALVENLQREDLDPIERAEAFAALVSEFGLTHSQIAERVGMDRSSVANTIRLNSLDAQTKSDIRAGRLSQGHAKALLAITDASIRRALAQSAVRQGWTVRRLEREVEEIVTSNAGAAPARKSRTKGEHITSLEERLSKALHLPARIRQSGSRTSGQIIFTFRALEEFETFLKRAER